jgi:hypothetical protein
MEYLKFYAVMVGLFFAVLLFIFLVLYLLLIHFQNEA